MAASKDKPAMEETATAAPRLTLGEAVGHLEQIEARILRPLQRLGDVVRAAQDAEGRQTQVTTDLRVKTLALEELTRRIEAAEATHAEKLAAMETEAAQRRLVEEEAHTGRLGALQRELAALTERHAQLVQAVRDTEAQGQQKIAEIRKAVQAEQAQAETIRADLASLKKKIGA